VVSGPGLPGDPRHSSRPHPRELPNRTHAHHASRARTRPRESASEPPEETRDRATVPAAVDRAQRVLSPVSHATRVLALFTEPEVGPFRDTSYQASRPAATRVAHSRIRLARQASSPSSPSRWHARPARQLLYVTGRPSWLADDQGHRPGAQASSGVVTLAGYPRSPLTSSLVRRHPAHDRAQQVPPGQRPLAALGQDGAALAHLQRGLLPGPSGREVVIPGPVGRRQQVPACGPLSGRTVG
jgi:hypothetical protein